MKRNVLKHHSLALALGLALPLAAFAHDAVVVDDVGLQAGPDTDYPTITQVPGGTEVQVQGCIAQFSWCDVVASGDRGWVPGSYLAEELDNQRVLVIDAGPRIGLPLVSFEIGTYWNEHYHNRPFYAQRETFVSRHITPHAPPRPSEVALTKQHVVVQGAAQTAQSSSTNVTTGNTQTTRQTASGGAASQTDVHAQADIRAREQQQATHSTASRSGTSTRSSTDSDKTAASDRNGSSTRSGSASLSGTASGSVNGTTSGSSGRNANRSGSSSSDTQQTASASHRTPSTTASSSGASKDTATSKDQAENRATAETRDNERNVPNVRADQREGAQGMAHTTPPTVQSGNGQQRQVASAKSQNAQTHEQQSKQPPKSDKDTSKDNGDKQHDRDNDH